MKKKYRKLRREKKFNRSDESTYILFLFSFYFSVTVTVSKHKYYCVVS